MCFSEIKASHRDEDDKFISQNLSMNIINSFFVNYDDHEQGVPFQYQGFFNNNGIEVVRKNTSRIPYVFMNPYDFFKTPNDAEFLFF